MFPPGNQCFQVGPPTAYARPSRDSFNVGYNCGGLQKLGTLSRLAAPKQLGTCSPQAATPAPSLQPHKVLALGPCSDRDRPRRAGVAHRQGVGAKAQSGGSGGLCGTDPSRAVLPMSRMAADGDR